MDETLRAQADRLAIIDVIDRYGIAVDAGDWERLKSCFTPDAVVHFSTTALNGPDAVVEFIAAATAGMPVQQHLLGNHEVTIEGDRATASTYLHATQIEPGGEGIVNLGGVYRDVLVRSGGGWKIRERTLTPGWRERRALNR